MTGPVSPFRLATLAAFVTLATLSLPVATLAQTVPSPADAGGALDRAIDAMKGTLDATGERLARLATGLMLTFLLVEFVWRGGKWAITGQSLEDVVQPLAYTIGLVSVVWGVAQVIPEIVRWLADTALRIADGAGAGPDADVSASDIVTSGLRRCAHWLDRIQAFRPGTYFYLLVAAVSLVTLAIEVAMVVVIYAELYLVGLVGIVTLGFAGLSQTRDIARGYFMTLVGKAFKLLGLLVVIRGVHSMSETVADGPGTGFENALGVTLLQIVGATLVLTLPATLERLVGGAKAGGAAEAAGRYVGSGAASAIHTAGGAAARNAPGLVKSAADRAGVGGFDWSRIASQGQLRSKLLDRFGGGSG